MEASQIEALLIEEVRDRGAGDGQALRDRLDANRGVDVPSAALSEILQGLVAEGHLEQRSDFRYYLKRSGTAEEQEADTDRIFLP